MIATKQVDLRANLKKYFDIAKTSVSQNSNHEY